MTGHTRCVILSLQVLACQGYLTGYYSIVSLTVPLDNLTLSISHAEASSRALCSAKCRSDDSCNLFSYTLIDKNCTLRQCKTDSPGVKDVLDIPTEVTARVFLQRGIACKQKIIIPRLPKSLVQKLMFSLLNILFSALVWYIVKTATIFLAMIKKMKIQQSLIFFSSEKSNIKLQL